MFKTPSMDRKAMDLPLSDYRQYSRNHNIFPTTFEVNKSFAIPDLNGSFGFGRTFRLGGNKMDVLATFGIDTDNESLDNAYVRTFEASGTEMSRFDYDSFTQTLKMAGLASVGYSFRKADRVGFSAFYARNAVDSYMARQGMTRKHPLER